MLLICRLLLLSCFCACNGNNVSVTVVEEHNEPAHSRSWGCSGDKHCQACKNCKYCKHCSKRGGTCGVCK